MAADVILSDGREITFNLNKVTIKEYRALFDVAQPDQEEYAILAKASGLTAEAVGNLGFDDWRLFATAFFEKAREPLADTNSVSASTST